MYAIRSYYDKQLPVKHKSVKVGGYGRFLEKVLKVKWPVILFATLLVVGSVLLVPFIGTEFMPKTESREFTVDLRLQEGTELSRTESTVRNIEKILTDYLGENLDLLYSQVGPTSGISGDESSVFEGENTAEIKVKLASYNFV